MARVLVVLLLRLLVLRVLIPGIFVLVVLARGLILVPKMFKSEISVFLSQVLTLRVLVPTRLISEVLASRILVPRALVFYILLS